jgi:general secretion pathway protein F
MPLYEAKVKKGVNVRTIELQARNESEALAHVSRLGQVITFKKKIGLDFSPGLTTAERQIFFKRLSSMLSARVGTSDALMLLQDTFTGKIQEVSARTLRYLEAGDDLAQAFERIGSKDFPDATVALIKAGSRSGKTWKAIRDAADFEYQLHSIKSGAAKGLWTGVAAFVGAGILTIVSTLYVGPEIMNSTLIQAANANGAVNIDFINNTAYVVGYLMTAILIMGVLFWLLASVGRKLMPIKADNLILKIPFYKDLVLSRNNFIVLYGLALLIRSGVRTEDALRLSSEGAPRGALRHDLQTAVDAVRNGRPWPKVMRTLHPTDKAALLSATDREQVSSTLDTLANQYRDLYAQRLSSFVPMVNLLAALFLSIAGGLIFGQSILPMLQATKGLL